ncbi:hypothetical protein CPC08DRAFT_219846 [Agrocybe pediades]|nr:hypothetical protein CPC08DRAFT_219846 [Agrocybe pediades]
MEDWSHFPYLAIPFPFPLAEWRCLPQNRSRNTLLTHLFYTYSFRAQVHSGRRQTHISFEEFYDFFLVLHIFLYPTYIFMNYSPCYQLLQAGHLVTRNDIA